MNVVLMHKNIEVALLQLNSDGEMLKVKVLNKSFMPIGGSVSNKSFYDWWKFRAVPRTRQNCRSALERLGYIGTGKMMVDNLSLSLNDCYWIKPYGSALRWEDVNLFNNKFTDIFGAYTFDTFYNARNITKFTSTSVSGDLQKKWMISRSGKRVLVKGNYGNGNQQSVNEVFASLMHKKQSKQPYVQYRLCKIQTRENHGAVIGCASDNFCSEKIESIPLWEVMEIQKRKNDISPFEHAKQSCIRLGIDKDYFQEYMDYMIMTDFIISNTDRHMGNISIMRDSDSLKILGFSPLYDFGNSMLYKKVSKIVSDKEFRNIKTNSFVSKELNMLKLVQNRQAVNLNRLPTQREFFTIYNKCTTLNDTDIAGLYSAYQKKCKMLYEFQHGTDIWKRGYKTAF